MAHREFPGLATRKEVARYQYGLATLTPTEREVFFALLKYRKCETIASMTSMQLSKVETCRNRILRRTGLHSTFELLIYAHVVGLFL